MNRGNVYVFVCIVVFLLFVFSFYQMITDWGHFIALMNSINPVFK